MDRLEPDLQRWIEESTGQRVASAVRLPGGNRRQAWVIDTQGPGQTVPPVGQRLFLRSGEDTPGDPYSLRREALVYRALSDSPVRQPRLVAVHPAGHALLMEHAEGEARYRSVTDPGERLSIADDLARELAVLHLISPSQLELGALGPVVSAGEHVRQEVANWEGLYRDSATVDPLIEHSLAWMGRRIGELDWDDVPVVLCHGDAGPGNFLFRNGSLTALLDWELAHLGDPMEDLAWVSMRHVLEPLPDFGRFLARYEEAVGARIDPRRIAFFRVLVQLRVAIIRHRDDGAAVSNSDAANSLVSRALNRRLLLEALAEAAQVELPGVALPIPSVPGDDWLFDELLTELRDTIAPVVSDERAAAKLKSNARIVKYLRRVLRYGPAYEAAEMAELAELLADAPDDLASGRRLLGAAIRNGAIADPQLWRYLSGVIARETSMMRDALGQLAERHLPPLAVAPLDTAPLDTAPLDTARLDTAPRSTS